MNMPNKKQTSEDQFILYYNKLRDEINRAYTYHEICKTIEKLKRTHPLELSEAITFFQVTINANLCATVMSLCRFLDKSGNSLNLDKFFSFIKKNLGMFSTQNYKRRLSDGRRDKEDCEYWAKNHHEITENMVEQDMLTVKNLPIKNLKIWRNKKLAHIEKEFVLSGVDVASQNPIKIQEIDHIVTTIHEILDRYRNAFDGVGWILGLPSTKHQIEYIFSALSLLRKSRIAGTS